MYTYCVFYHVLAKNIHLQFEIFYFQTQNTSAYFNGIYTLQHCWYVNVKDKAWHRQVRLHIPISIRFVKIQIVWYRQMIQWYLRLQIIRLYLRGILYEYIQQTSFVIVMSCTIFIRVRPHVITHKDCCPLSMLIKRNVFIVETKFNCRIFKGEPNS